MEIYKIVGIILVSLSLIIVLKNIKREDFALFLTIIISVILMFFVLEKVEKITELLNNFITSSGISSDYLYLLIKVMGISYIVEIVSNICKDSGSLSLASKMELIGKLSIVYITIPLLTTVVSTITDIL